MKYAKYWGAIADHSGDAYFDFVYWHDWPNTLNELAKYRAPKRRPGRYAALAESRRNKLREGIDDGRIKRFLTSVWKKEKLSTAETHCIMPRRLIRSGSESPRRNGSTRAAISLPVESYSWRSTRRNFCTR